MQHKNQWMVVVLLIIAALQLTACAQVDAVSALKTGPAVVEKQEGTEFNRVRLTEKAAQRINIQTAKIREEQVNGKARKVVPYAAVIYGLKGETWIYTSAEPLLFVRQPVKVDYIEGEKAFLADGPATGVEVATVGVPELYGADTGVGK